MRKNFYAVFGRVLKPKQRTDPKNNENKHCMQYEFSASYRRELHLMGRKRSTNETDRTKRTEQNKSRQVVHGRFFHEGHHPTTHSPDVDVCSASTVFCRETKAYTIVMLCCLGMGILASSWGGDGMMWFCFRTSRIPMRNAVRIHA